VRATLAHFTGLHREAIIPDQESGRLARPKYIVTVIANTNPWIETMKPYMPKNLGSDVLGARNMAMSSTAWAPIIATTYGGAIRRYFYFSDEHMLGQVGATPAYMARYVA
jgi:hypothetical protein